MDHDLHAEDGSFLNGAKADEDHPNDKKAADKKHQETTKEENDAENLVKKM